MVQFETKVDADRRAWLGRQLGATNVAASPHLAGLQGTDAEDDVALHLFALDDDGTIVGGLAGYTWAYWLHVDLLWVDATRRGTGLGAELLARAEKTARNERDCRHVRLATWEFQAPGFYRKQGYELVGTVPDYPPGSTEYIFAKRLG
ncbi:GNAT family N-acetyltransferase [Embleya sp. NPDC008237]|uniref:GNAT family N-acetyltransferase n=1 Tax=Embleya sp. NPDC008237 TaxID=3363978 RepID=UPI0036E80FCC